MNNAILPAKQPEPIKKPSTTAHLIAGGTAGLLSAFTLQPLDLLKTRLQQQQKEVVGYRTSIGKELRKLANIKDLWRGVIPSTLRTSVGAGLYFTILSQTRSYLETLKPRSQNENYRKSSLLPKLSHAENLATGFVVRAIVGVITMPITVIKTRFESNMYNYNSMYEGFEGIYASSPNQPGSYRNFFKGTVATLARDCPYAGIYVLFYEGFKNEVFPSVLRGSHYDEAVTSGINNSLSAICAACVSTTVTAPFDAIKTRLQLSTQAGSSSILAATKTLLSEPGGFMNLFSGLSLRLGRKALSAGISWCLYEELLKHL